MPFPASCITCSHLALGFYSLPFVESGLSLRPRESIHRMASKMEDDMPKEGVCNRGCVLVAWAKSCYTLLRYFPALCGGSSFSVLHPAAASSDSCLRRLFLTLTHTTLSHATLSQTTHNSVKRNFVTNNSVTHNFVTHKFVANNAATHNFVTHNFVRQLCHKQHCHKQLCHTDLCHTQLCHKQHRDTQLCRKQLCHTQLRHTLEQNWIIVVICRELNPITCNYSKQDFLMPGGPQRNNIRMG